MVDSTTRHKSLPLQRSVLTLLLGINVITVPMVAHANIFDPILKVLLPFYDGKTPDQSNSDVQNDDEHASENSSETSSKTSKTSVITPSGQANQSQPLMDDANPQDKVDQALLQGIDDNTPLNNQQTYNNQETANNDVFDLLAIDEVASIASPPIKPEPNLYALLTAEFASDRGDIDTALYTYKQQAFGKNATAVFERALTLSLEYEQPAESLVFASEWYRQNPDHVPAWFYVAHLALQAHDYQLAGQTLSQILTYDPKADLSQILEGIYPEEDADQRELLTTLQQLNSEENSALSVLQAGLLLQQDQPKIALIYVDRALRFEPDTVPYITLKADILKQLKKPKKVLAFIRKARKRLPEAKNLYLYEIRYLLGQSESKTKSESESESKSQAPHVNLNNKARNKAHQQALTLLLEASERFPEDPEITLLASLVSLDSEEYQTGDQLLNKLLDRPAYIDQAYYYLGISSERQHRYHDAKIYFTKVMQEDLVLKARQKVVAYALLNNDSQEAINTLIELRQNFAIYAPESYILQANILEQQGSHISAKQLLAKAQKAFPEDLAIEFAYAKILDDKTNYRQKYRLLEHLQQQEPDNLHYKLLFAKLLLTHNPNSEIGKQLAEEVVDTPYSDAKFDSQLYLQGLNILAVVALEKQQYSQVVDYLQMPFEIMPNLATGKLLLQAYQGLGNENQLMLLQAQLKQQFDYSPIPSPVNIHNDSHTEAQQPTPVEGQNRIQKQNATSKTINNKVLDYMPLSPVNTTQDFQKMKSP